jgi:hypothetical protein
MNRLERRLAWIEKVWQAAGDDVTPDDSPDTPSGEPIRHLDADRLERERDRIIGERARMEHEGG